MATFVPGLVLNADFYGEAVEPLIRQWPHAAARIGWGSEVLGLDSERSTDHGWGPQLAVFVDPTLVERVRGAIDEGLPESFRGWPVRYGWDETPVTHHVTVTTLGRWLMDHLGVDVLAGLSNVDWLLLPQQKLLEATAGAVYRDDTGELDRARTTLSWYPEEIWYWIMAAEWRRVAQEEAFVGCAAESRDQLGSRLLTGRLARELMRLWFLLSREYWPYPKWFGSAFARLRGSSELGEVLATALAADEYADREMALAAAYELVGRRHNELGVTEAVDPSTRPYHGRPYRVLMADRFVDACLARVGPELVELPLVGAIDQVSDSADLLNATGVTHRLVDLYAAP